MPKIKYINQKKAPQVDWLWAAILERMRVNGYDLKRMAVVAGVGYEYMRKLINRPTTEWPHGALSNICKEFGIRLLPSVGGSTPEDLIR